MKKTLTIVFLAIMSLTYGQNLAQDNGSLLHRLRLFDKEAYNLAINDIKKSYPTGKIDISKSLEFAEKLSEKKSEIEKGILNNDKKVIKQANELLDYLEEVILVNAAPEFDDVLILRRKIGQKKARLAVGGELGIVPNNFTNNSTIKNPSTGWTNDIIQISISDRFKEADVIYAPKDTRIVSDLDLHFNSDKILFSSIGTHNRWHLFSLDLKTGQIQQITPTDITDFDCFDGCFLPGGDIIFCSTATFLGLPCINGRPRMSGLYKINPGTKKIKQLTFDQDSNWEPVVMDNGKILYQRWEYSGIPHSNSRIMFTMNPDGTTQLAHYGSNSYFPTAFFGAKPIPGNPSAMVGIATGHHSIPQSGRMMVIDVSKGRHEADGVLTEIPYRGHKVEATVRDRYADGEWPRFLNPYPLNDKYFVVSMKASPKDLWGVYLVDVFNNMILIHQEEGSAMVEAIPFRKRKTPPIIPDRTNPESKTANVFIQDIYHGGGLKGIPRGEVKRMRIGSYYFSPYGQGGLLGTIGMDGPWDIMRILGEVPVEEDGSATFTIPANTPVFLQPLDSTGAAMQVMRSWFTAMPGENVSCIGCHENRNEVALPKATVASRKKPHDIENWYGEERGFSFRHEIQPLLDKYCVSCHNDDNKSIPYLKGDKMITDWKSDIKGHANPSYGGRFSESYAQLHRYVRRPGIESDMHILTPMDVHASQTELVRMLKKGHKNLQPDEEFWHKLYCWIDFNAPYHGQRKDIPNYCDAEKSVQRMKENALKYGNREINFDNLPDEVVTYSPMVPPTEKAVAKGDEKPDGWPIPRVNEGQDEQIKLGLIRKELDIGSAVKLKLVKVPAGNFLMGSDNYVDEQPETAVNINKAFWIGQFEITNEQYAQFNSQHDSRHEHRHGYQFGRLGYSLNKPDQPVCRVSWNEATAFCKWLSQKTGYKFSLPTEAQWEWACRAGSDTDFSFGNIGDDFSNYANFGDMKLAEFAAHTSHRFYESTTVIENPGPYDDWIPRDTTYNDFGFVSEHVGRYRPNLWDIFDMHGNVWEWTNSDYTPYPYNDKKASENQMKVARGGSWYFRPEKGTSSYRVPYRPYQKVFDVGFRVVMVDEAL